MSQIYKTLLAITAWMLFIWGAISLIVPTVLGLVTGSMVGTINDGTAGELWFYRHGLSFIIGFLFLLGYAYAVRVMKSSD